MVNVNVEQHRLLCPQQWLNVRNGDTFSNDLLVHLKNSFATDNRNSVQTDGDMVLIEFYSEQFLFNMSSCNAAFIINVVQKRKCYAIFNLSIGITLITFSCKSEALAVFLKQISKIAK